jgi:hypothetical protein
MHITREATMQRHAQALQVVIFGLVFFLCSTDIFAQRGINRNESGGWGTGSNYGRMYDTNTVETIKGRVTKVERIIQTKGRSCGIHLMIKTDKETISVHLGPAWFIEKQDIKINVKDTLKVKGSRINYEGTPAIIAAEVEKENQTLHLRDEIGIPVWSGGGRRR